MEKANLTMMFLFLATISKQNMNNFLKHIMETNVLRSLIKNVVTTSKGDWYLKAQQYIILIMVVNEVTWTCLFKLHIKLSIVWLTLREINTFPIISLKKMIFFSNSSKKIGLCFFTFPRVHPILPLPRRSVSLKI